MNKTIDRQRYVDNNLRDVRRHCRFQHKNIDASERQMFLTREPGKIFSNTHLPRQWTGTHCLAHCRDSWEESCSRHNIGPLSHLDYPPWILKSSEVKTFVKYKYKLK